MLLAMIVLVSLDVRPAPKIPPPKFPAVLLARVLLVMLILPVFDVQIAPPIPLPLDYCS